MYFLGVTVESSLSEDSGSVSKPRKSVAELCFALLGFMAAIIVTGGRGELKLSCFNLGRSTMV